MAERGRRGSEKVVQTVGLERRRGQVVERGQREYRQLLGTFFGVTFRWKLLEVEATKRIELPKAVSSDGQRSSLKLSGYCNVQDSTFSPRGPLPHGSRLLKSFRGSILDVMNSSALIDSCFCLHHFSSSDKTRLRDGQSCCKLLSVSRG